MSDRFRTEYRQLHPMEVALVKSIKTKAAEMEALFEQMTAGREKALALTNLEQAVMWATKGIGITG